MLRSRRLQPRDGVAAVELAVIMPLLLILLLGLWEVGRIVQVNAILNNAVRDGARVAAQGQIINLTGTFTQIRKGSGTSIPNVTDTVKRYLTGAGVSTTGLTVTFTFVDSSGNPVSTPSEPYQGVKGQRFRVTATLPYNSFRWSTIDLIPFNSIQATIDWVSMIDDPFTVNTSLPNWAPVP
jgi:hypothetical protein